MDNHAPKRGRETADPCPPPTDDGLPGICRAPQDTQPHFTGDGEPVVDSGAGVDVHTPDGPAVLTIVAAHRDIELHPAVPGRRPAIRGDRVILRSHVDGLDDVYRVVERTRHDPLWRPVTGDLTTDQVAATWTTDHCPAAASLSPRVNAWLTHTLAHQR